MEVTNHNFGALLVQSLEEAVEIKEGRRAPARVDTVQVTTRRAKAAPPPSLSAAKIRAVRKRMKLSQTLFAGVLNVSVATVRAWEQGARVPDGASLRLLEIAETHPDVLMARLAPT